MISDCRLHRNNVETTAHVKELYKSGKGHNIKCVSHAYCVNNEWYNGHTSPPDSIWDNIQIGDPFEIIYEKDNPANNNWGGTLQEIILTQRPPSSRTAAARSSETNSEALHSRGASLLLL